MLFGCQQTQESFETDSFVSDRYTKKDFSAIEKQIGEDVQDLFDGERVIEKVTYWGDEESQKYGEYYDDTLEWTPSDWIVVDVKFEGHPRRGIKWLIKRIFKENGN